MKMAREDLAKRDKRTRRIGGPFVALMTAGLVAGCSQVPDAVNPVEWYNNSVEFFAGEDGDEPQKAESMADAQQKSPAPDAEKETFPTLSTVDQKKQRAAQRSSGLVADVEGRKYAPAIARQGEVVNALNAPPAPPPVATIATSAPAAQPVAPVLTARSGDAAAPAPVKPRQLPTTGNAQHDNFQDRFALRLAEIRAQAAKGTQFPAASNPIPSVGNNDTVVISSNGIETGYGEAAPQLAQVTASVNSELTYINKPMSALGPGAVKVATIRFKNGSAILSSRDRQILASVLELRKERGGRIRVVGHASSRTRNTDPVKHKMINFQVSAARADAIAAELMRMGAERAELQIDAISDSAPQFLEVMPTGEAGNRRAEIYLES